MKKNNCKVSIHMVSSLDGFIAKKDKSVTWLESSDTYEKGIHLSDEEIAAFLDGIDCYVMGSHTYEHALELGWPYGDKPVVVLSSRNLKTERKNLSFYSGDLKKLVEEELSARYRHIWIAGGAMLSKEFLRLKLADEIIVSIMPILLGEGVLFFDFIGIEQKLHLKDVKAYTEGMVELSYEIVKEE